MGMQKTLAKVMVAGALCIVASVCATLAADPPASTSPIVIVDSGGKEQKVKGWTFSQGTRRLTWLAPAPKDEPKEEPKEDKKDGPKGKVPAKVRPKAGPEALEFRQEHSTTFVEGVLTLIPLDRIRAIEYDDKDGVTVKVTLSPKADEDLTLKGTTKYKGINKITIEAEVDKGDLGVAELKFLGGVPKGIRAVRFEMPKPSEQIKGRSSFVTIAEKGQKDSTHVVDLQPLYQSADGHEQLLPTLMFKKTLKLDLAKVRKIVVHEGRDPDAQEWTVTLKDDSELTLTLLRTITHENKQLLLQGLIGKVPAGYMLYPLHTIAEIQFDEQKGGEKP